MPEHIDSAIRESCPFLKTDCFLARIGACSAVNYWIYEHRAQWAAPKKEIPTDLLREFSKRGGQSTRQRRRVHAIQ